MNVSSSFERRNADRRSLSSAARARLHCQQRSDQFPSHPALPAPRGAELHGNCGGFATAASARSRLIIQRRQHATNLHRLPCPGSRSVGDVGYLGQLAAGKLEASHGMGRRFRPERPNWDGKGRRWNFSARMPLLAMNVVRTAMGSHE
jgi:hypothetical protein